MLRNLSHNGHIKTSVLCRNRQIKTMRDEIPVFGDKKKQFFHSITSILRSKLNHAAKVSNSIFITLFDYSSNIRSHQLRETKQWLLRCYNCNQTHVMEKPDTLSSVSDKWQKGSAIWFRAKGSDSQRLTWRTSTSNPVCLTSDTISSNWIRFV